MCFWSEDQNAPDLSKPQGDGVLCTKLKSDRKFKKLENCALSVREEMEKSRLYSMVCDRNWG